MKWAYYSCNPPAYASLSKDVAGQSGFLNAIINPVYPSGQHVGLKPDLHF
jgi:hypothetical protein